MHSQRTISLSILSLSTHLATLCVFSNIDPVPGWHKRFSDNPLTVPVSLLHCLSPTSPHLAMYTVHFSLSQAGTRDFLTIHCTNLQKPSTSQWPRASLESRVGRDSTPMTRKSRGSDLKQLTITLVSMRELKCNTSFYFAVQSQKKGGLGYSQLLLPFQVHTMFLIM